ncbi:MAG: thioredoxin domain-containing protein, partial [Chitinophagaceae bacterium]
MAFLLMVICLSFLSCREPSNRLAASSSPYLQLHADNPVNWYEWGSEALAKAKKDNKPLLISIGFASCHWCHVMEKESFMDTAVARLMNENFVCIKVDREQHPDIDQVYMNACQLISGSSGWPLNAFAMPDGKPFHAGTYYSKQSWMSLLNQVSTAFRQYPGKVALQAASLTNGIAKLELNLLTNELD